MPSDFHVPSSFHLPWLLRWVCQEVQMIKETVSPVTLQDCSLLRTQAQHPLRCLLV